MSRQPEELAAAAVGGDRWALAKLISAVESSGADAALASLYAKGGQAHVVGVTGPPGAGKSTLTDLLITCARRRGPVAVVAVDPSSPFTGGAILGDRVRMQRHADDDQVYIRSLASRGHLGGVSGATPNVVAVLDAMGYPTVIVETVGVGQAEVDIAAQADTTLVIVQPRWGDSIQAAKAGLLEVGDIFVVNKSDLGGAEATATDLKQMLEMGPETPWQPPVLVASAASDTGIEEIWDAIESHLEFLDHSGGRQAARLRRARLAITQASQRMLAERAGLDEAALEAAARRVAEGSSDPWTEARLLWGAG